VLAVCAPEHCRSGGAGVLRFRISLNVCVHGLLYSVVYIYSIVGHGVPLIRMRFRLLVVSAFAAGFYLRACRIDGEVS